MKEFIARATIRTSKCINTGFLHVKKDIIEGTFTFDYVEIDLDGHQITMNISEETLEFESLKSSISHKIYKAPFPYNSFILFESYKLYDARKELLTLTIDSIVDNPDMKSKILDIIEERKENSIF